RRVSGSGDARLGIGFVDASDQITYSTVDTSSTSAVMLYIAGEDIPAGTVALRPFVGHRNAATGTCEFWGLTLSRGPVPQKPARIPPSANAMNLLPTGAGAVVTVLTGQTRYPGATAATRDIPLSVLGVQPGDVVCYSAVAQVTSAGGVARIALGWVDSGGTATYLSHAVVDYTGTSEKWLRIDGYMIPE